MFQAREPQESLWQSEFSNHAEEGEADAEELGGGVPETRLWCS